MQMSPAFPEVSSLQISEDKLSMYVCVNIKRLDHLKGFLNLFWRNSVYKLSAATATFQVTRPALKGIQST